MKAIEIVDAISMFIMTILGLILIFLSVQDENVYRLIAGVWLLTTSGNGMRRVIDKRK